MGSQCFLRWVLVRSCETCAASRQTLAMTGLVQLPGLFLPFVARDALLERQQLTEGLHLLGIPGGNLAVGEDAVGVELTVEHGLDAFDQHKVVRTRGVRVDDGKRTSHCTHMATAAITFFKGNGEPVLSFGQAFARCLVLVSGIGLLTQKVIKALLPLLKIALEGGEELFFLIEFRLHARQELTCIVEIRLIRGQRGDV